MSSPHKHTTRSTVSRSELLLSSHVPHDEEDRAPVPEPNPAQEKEAQNVVHEAANRRAGEEISQAEVLGVGGEGCPRENPEDDRRAGQDVVPKSADEMEVSHSQQ